MKLCKKETFFYWLVHSVVWIGIALPTLFFLLRINHPKHETEPKSVKFNVTKDNETLSPVFQNCTNYSRHSCLNIAAKKNSSENTSLSLDKGIETIVNEVLITKNTSTCKNSLENTLCLKKYFSCNQAKKGSYDGYTKLETQLVNVTKKFCYTCYKYSHIKSNTSLKTEIYNWLKNLSCISKLFEEKDKSPPEKNFTCCSYPLVKDENGTCRTPCDWSLMSPRLRDVYYVVMVINFWLALITSVITLATLASFHKMREFPHIVRFYILICSAMYATSSLLPLRIGLAKVYCGKERFWKEEGHSTTPTVISGIISHYFFLAFCFWSLCHVFNAYSVIIKHARNIFSKKCKYHFIQFSICSTLPALFVAINIAVKPPGYKSLFLDRMTTVFTSPVMEYLTFTLPVQIAIGVSVSLLWSIIRFVRKVRKSDTTFQSVRPDEDIRGFINAERQFIKLAILFIATVAVILCSEVVITYRNEEYLHEVEEYFECLKTSNKSCHKPEVQIYFLSSVKVCGPGVYCLLNFFLLIFNKDTRGVWRKWFRFGYNMSLQLCNWTEKDGKNSRQGLPKKNGTRARSATLDTNASLNSLNKFSIYTVVTAPSYKNTNTNTPPTTMRLESLGTDDEKNNSLTGSVSPKENSPLEVDTDKS